MIFKKIEIAIDRCNSCPDFNSERVWCQHVLSCISVENHGDGKGNYLIPEWCKLEDADSDMVVEQVKSRLRKASDTMIGKDVNEDSFEAIKNLTKEALSKMLLPNKNKAFGNMMRLAILNACGDDGRIQAGVLRGMGFGVPEDTPDDASTDVNEIRVEEDEYIWGENNSLVIRANLKFGPFNWIKVTLRLSFKCKDCIYWLDYVDTAYPLDGFSSACENHIDFPGYMVTVGPNENCCENFKLKNKKEMEENG